MKIPSENTTLKTLPVRLEVAQQRTSTCETCMSLMEAINSKKLRLGFRKFLESEYSVENLDFWLAVDEYKRIKDIKLRKSRAQEIYDEYVSATSPRQVNLDFPTQQEVTKELSCDLSRDANIFNAAQKCIFNIMENDSYSRFIRSKYFEACNQPSGRRSPRMILRSIMQNNTRSRNRSGSPC